MNHTIEFALLEPVGLVHYVNVPARVRAVLKASWEPLTVSEIMERGNLSRPEVLEGLDWLGVAVERVGRDKYRTIGVRALRRTPFTVHHDRAATGGSVATFRDVGKDRGIQERGFSTQSVAAKTTYTPELAAQYLQAREDGASHNEASALIGKAPVTVRDWARARPDFRDRMQAAVESSAPLIAARKLQEAEAQYAFCVEAIRTGKARNGQEVYAIADFNEKRVEDCIREAILRGVLRRRSTQRNGAFLEYVG